MTPQCGRIRVPLKMFVKVWFCYLVQNTCHQIHQKHSLKEDVVITDYQPTKANIYELLQSTHGSFTMNHFIMIFFPFFQVMRKCKNLNNDNSATINTSLCIRYEKKQQKQTKSWADSREVSIESIQEKSLHIIAITFMGAFTWGILLPEEMTQ